VKFLLEHAAGALFLDPGLGKTSITLAAVKMLKKKKVLSKVLLIAPLRVCHSVWPKEVVKWKDFEQLKIVVLHGAHKDQLLKEEADIYVINPEGLDWLLDVKKSKTPAGKTRVKVDIRRFKKLGFDTLIIDELSKFKHANTNRFKSLKVVLPTFKRRWGLTGSPAANGLLGLFGQCYVLDEGRSLGQYITQYRAKYFDPSFDGFNWVLRKGADQEIYKRLKPLALRIGDDVLDMPKVVENNIKVQLPPKVMKIYIDLETDLLAQLEDGILTAQTAAVASIKCRQVANGGVYIDPQVEALVKLPSTKKEWVDLHEEKLDALESLIDELQGSPLLVAYQFGHDLTRLQKRFGKDVPYIGGGVTVKRAQELEIEWNKGNLPFLLGHPQSIAHGLNLQEVGNHIAWHSLTWDYELYDQFNRRVLRQGNKSKRVFIHHLVAEDTIDEVMLITLKGKRRGQNALFDALKTLQKRRRTS
jgi:SNF2 family DNA or RNA helicase